MVAIAGVVVVAGCGGGGDGRSAMRPFGSSEAAAPSVPMVVVPRLVGRSQDDAHRLAARAGLKLRWTGFIGKLGNGRYEVPCVKVHSQSPVAGERRPRGALIAVIEAACRTPSGKPHVL